MANPTFLSDGSTPRRTDARWAILQKILGATIDGGGGGGGVNVTGSNFCFGGTSPNKVLKVKNNDTGLYNQVNALGADGSQTITLSNGTTC